MKGKDAHLGETKYEEHKDSHSGNDNNFYSSSSVPFKVEEKLGIPMFNGKTNVEALDS